MKNFIFATVFLIFSFNTYSQTPVIAWDKSYGGTYSDFAKSMTSTSDGGYIIVGLSQSIDGDVTGNQGVSDYWVIKIDEQGSLEWQKSIGGSDTDMAFSVAETADNGYIIAGYSSSTDGDVSGLQGGWDYWVVKLNTSGDILWESTLGGSMLDKANAVFATNDGGCVVTGYTTSTNGDVTGNNGGTDVWVVKLDANGSMTWQKTLGGTNNDAGYSIQQTSDNGYIVLGETSSSDGDVSVLNGSYDCWVIKLNSTGNLIWEKTYGGSGSDHGYDIHQTNDGGYIIGGASSTADGNVSVNYGDLDCWIIKVDGLGNITWENSFGGSSTDVCESIQETIDGGYVFTGSTMSNDGQISVNNGDNDYWVVKLDGTGGLLWEKTLGGTGSDEAIGINETINGDYIVAGTSYSIDGDVTTNLGAQDYWVVKLDVANVIGSVFFDPNTNCSQDISENGIEDYNLIINPGNIIVNTNSIGQWWADSLAVGIYTITIDTTTSWMSTCNTSQTFTVTNANGFTDGPNFGVTNTSPCSDPNISIYAPFLRPCFSGQQIYVSACNQSMATGEMIGVYVDVELDSLLIPTASTLPYTDLGNHVYRFNLGNLNPGNCIDFQIEMDVHCDAFLGQTLCMDAKLYPVDSCALDSIPTDSLSSGGGVDLLLPVYCDLPWDQSSLNVEGWCADDSVHFSITNTGDFLDGDMECYAPVFLFINDTLVMIDSIQIQGQETIFYSFPANGETYILSAEQHPLHPGNSHPNAHVEACGDTNDNWVSDLINNQPLNDSDPITDIYCGVVSSSYDPNDKTGYPLGVGGQHLIQPNQQLQYVVRFQNTGSDTAFTVVVSDTLDTDMNTFTVTPGVSSHPYTFTMSGSGVLEWTFNDIQLPDSTTNEVASHGFLTFTVNQNNDLPNGTHITNEAGIYFDFNDPIITNQTDHFINNMVMTSPLTIEENTHNDNGSLINAYPNPFNDNFAVDWEGISSYDIKVYDLNGKLLIHNPNYINKSDINLSNIQSGMYVIVTTDVDLQSNQVLVVKE